MSTRTNTRHLITYSPSMLSLTLISNRQVFQTFSNLENILNLPNTILFMKDSFIPSYKECISQMNIYLIKAKTPKKGGVSSNQTGLILPSVAETDPKINQNPCNLQFSICSRAGGKVLSLKNHHSLF